ncbi:hypothetical protein SPHINGO391_530054 [Sphingomonas aurantiaca]|uniref:Uncharacterized protein n=1 Tax=Sphingomonas aurantiaca TaxID=185949 RepID=A0A5E8AKM4_9SPHN|nr:hypothetical protein SPHINGO391_530054 [Sphingomonas aurantiaca]
MRRAHAPLRRARPLPQRHPHCLRRAISSRRRWRRVLVPPHRRGLRRQGRVAGTALWIEAYAVAPLSPRPAIGGPAVYEAKLQAAASWSLACRHGIGPDSCGAYTVPEPRVTIDANHGGECEYGPTVRSTHRLFYQN